MYTECPNCHTTFRVSTAQLKLAEGKVRCGRCDHVFNAVAHLLDDVPGPVAQTNASSELAPVSELANETVNEAINETISEPNNESLESLSDMMPVESSIQAAEEMEQALSEVAIPGLDEGMEGESLDDLGLASSSPDDGLEDEDLFSAPAIEEVEELALGEEPFGSEPDPADGLDGLDLDGDLSDLDMAEAAEPSDDLELNEDDFDLDGVEVNEDLASGPEDGPALGPDESADITAEGLSELDTEFDGVANDNAEIDLDAELDSMTAVGNDDASAVDDLLEDSPRITLRFERFCRCS